MTIQGLINKIFKANQTQNNTVSWTGVNGLKSIQEDIVQTIRERTFFTVPTTSDLVNQGFNNAILCYVQDHAFFRWQAQGIPNGTTIFPANDGGVWVQETLGDTDGTVTSIGLSMPAAFTVANSPVTTSGVIGVTANGTSAQYIKGDGTLGTLPTPTGGTVTNVSALTLNTSGTDLSSTVANPTTTPVITLSVPTASAVNRGVLSPTDWTTFNNKQNAITLTTTGTSGAATLVGSTLNIPQYQSVITNPVTGTGTTNYMPKWTSSSALGNSLVYDDGTNIGIGTTTPGYKLDVNGTGRVQTSFTIGGASDGTFYFPNTTSGHQIRIYSQFASNALVLYANGYNLQLNGAGGMTTNLCTTITGSNGSAALTVQQGNSAWTPVAVFNAIGSTGTQFNTNGNVLIGTTTDAGYKLDVNGTIRSSSTVYGVNVANTNNNPVIGSDGSNIYLGSNQLYRIVFTGNNINLNPSNGSSTIAAMSASSANGGSVYIGGNANPSARLQVSGSITAATALAQGVYFNNTLVAAANNDVLVGLDVNPTYTNGAFTGVQNYAARISGALASVTKYMSTGTGATSHYLEIISTSSTNTYVNLVRNAGANGTYAYYLNAGTAYLSVDNGSGETRLYANGGGYYLTFFSNGAEAMRIPTTRNVLIGTTTDAGYKLDVNGTARTTSLVTANYLTINNAAGGGNVLFTYTGTSPFIYSDTYAINIGSNGNGGVYSTGVVQIFNQPNLSNILVLYGGNSSGTEKLRVTSGGNMLIGTTTDAGYKLDVYGTLRILSGNGSRIEGGGSFTATGFCNFNGAAQSVAGTNCGLLNVQSSLSVGFQGAADASAIMQANSTTKGFLKPRMTTIQRNAIATPATGLEVYNTTTNTEDYYNGTTWVSLQTSAAAVKSFGAWQHNVTQTAAANNTGYGVKFATGDITGQGVDVINDLSGNPTLIKMNNTGYYNIQFSFQFQNTDTGDQDVTIWLRKNGETTPFDVSSSAGFISVPSSHGGTPGHCIAAWNYFVQANAGDYFQLVWSTTLASRVEMEYYAAGSPPPSAASAILTVNQIN
ncbi:hypothetical protein EB001_02825 [bacterium]|nr:hypothetical protein [bacterium]